MRYIWQKNGPASTGPSFRNNMQLSDAARVGLYGAFYA